MYPSSIPGLGRSPGEEIGYSLQYSWASLVVLMVKNPPAMWEIRVWSLDWEAPLEEGMATHSSILAWRIPMDRGAWRAYSPWGHKESYRTEWLSTAQHKRHPKGFPVESVVKNSPVIQKTQVQSLSQEDPLEKGIVTYSSILAWLIPWTEEPGRL